MRRLIPVLAVAGLAAAACGSNGSNAGSVANGPATTQASKDVQILSPANGANVTMPLTVKIKTKEAIGPLDSGKDHVHYVIDGKENQYQVVTSTTHVIQSLPMGQHTIKVSLQHADHSPVGPLVQISVNVTGGNTTSNPNPGNSGGGYNPPGY